MILEKTNEEKKIEKEYLWNKYKERTRRAYKNEICKKY